MTPAATSGQIVAMPAKTTKTKATSNGSARRRGASPPVLFEATLEATSVGRAIVRLPDDASKRLPSRGQVAVDAVIGGHAFTTVVEPDGEFGHWMNVDTALQGALGLGPGDETNIELTPALEWPEPAVPKDLARALSGAAPDVKALWKAITPMARWEWVRWINETKSPVTRSKRIDVSISKLSSGKRRPCCFNLASCTDPELAKSGKLAVSPRAPLS